MEAGSLSPSSSAKSSDGGGGGGAAGAGISIGGGGISADGAASSSISGTSVDSSDSPVFDDSEVISVLCMLVFCSICGPFGGRSAQSGGAPKYTLEMPSRSELCRWPLQLRRTYVRCVCYLYLLCLVQHTTRDAISSWFLLKGFSAWPRAEAATLAVAMN